MVPAAAETVDNRAIDTQLASRSGRFTLPAGTTSTGQEAAVDGMFLIRSALNDKGFSPQSIDIILKSWRDSTKKQYLTYVHKWIQFCNMHNLNIFTADIAHILVFLTDLVNTGLTYSANNTARSALSSFLGITVDKPVGTDALVVRFMKGVARDRPSLPRYNCIWDVNVVLNMFRKQPLAEFLSLYDLTLRTVTLLALVSAQRTQSIHLLDTECMTVSKDKYVFHLHGDFKQARLGHEHFDVVLHAFDRDITICIFNTLSIYLTKTRDLRLSSKLFVSTVQPHKQVSKDTISRWIKATKMAGVDVTVFKPHSTRAAATSAASRKGVQISEILNVAGWSNATTFARFYNKPLSDTECSSTRFAESLLQT